MKRLTPRQYATMLYTVTRSVTGEKELSAAVGVFVRMLQKRQALRQSEAIMTAFIEYVNEQSGVAPVSVTTARSLWPETRKVVQEAFNAHIREESVDEGLIGGMVVKAKNMLFDASVKGQLQRLHNQLLTR